MTDRRILFAATFLRALATGMMGVLLALYLADLKFGERAIGAVLSSGLWGMAAAAALATFAGDRLGRKRFLVVLSLLGALGAAACAFPLQPLPMAAAAFLGMLNGMGRDRGAALILEQAVLPATTTDEGRTKVFAYYNVLQDVGCAAGSLLAGLPWLIQRLSGAAPSTSMSATMGVAAGLGLAVAVLYLLLSPGVETHAARRALDLSPASKRVIFRISALFSLDSLGGGFVLTAIVSYYFYERFGLTKAQLGGLFFAARAANALSHFGAAWLAKRIGLVRTMVFTHVPSSLLLVTVTVAPTFPIAAALFLLREGLVEMDVPTRQSYVMAVVRPEERTFASGITTLVRLAMWALGPLIGGQLMKISLATPLLVGAGLKLLYDAMLFFAFRHVKPPEETG